MNIVLRTLLFVGSAIILLFVICKLKKSGLEITDSIFWLVLALLLIIVALFPGLVFWASGLLGFQSPSNFVFLIVVGVLLVRLFSQDCKIALLKRKLITMAQTEALEHESDSH